MPVGREAWGTSPWGQAAELPQGETAPCAGAGAETIEATPLRARSDTFVLKTIGQCVLPLLSMLAMILVIYRRVVAGRVLAGGDLQVYFYPYWMQVVRSLREGHLPLWNPTLFAGAPLAANSQVGLFYWLNWPFWLVSALSTTPSSGAGIPGAVAVARSLHLSVLIHLWLAALNGWILGRRIGLGRWAAAIAGLTYAGSGFLGLHVDHLNQLQALAWLPLLFLPGARILRAHGGTWWRFGELALAGQLHDVRWPRPLSVVAMGMIILSGHMQMGFIAVAGVVAWHLIDAVGIGSRLPGESGRSPGLGRMLWLWVASLLPFAVAGLVAGIQLLPTLQLAGLSGRSAGLGWREAVSFSLSPWQLLRALLPTYLVVPLLPEGVAYIGLVGLLAAGLGAIAGLKDEASRRRRLPWVVLLALGLLLALGAYNPLYLAATRLRVPGFVHFRAPARFLALYVLGASVLAAMGVQDIGRWLQASPWSQAQRPAWRRAVCVVSGVVLIAGVGVELVIAAEALPHAQATAARAYWDLRPATAHLVAGRQRAEAAGDVPPRFLSISQMLFEIGDKAEIEAIYGDRLSSDALWSYMVAAKQREILAPNLPLAFDVPAVDGYDGGLLPLRTFITFSELLIPGGTLDGRLRENLSQMPDSRWLDLLDVHYVLTDKTGDLWVDDILFDRQFQPVLAAGESLDIGWLPADFEANAVGLLYAGGPVEVSLQLADGRVLTRDLPARADIGGTDGFDFETVWMRWSGASSVTSLTFRSGQAKNHLIAASLVDERVGAFHALSLSDRFRLTHSGDVKIYEALTRPSRAVILHDCQVASSSSAALEAMASASFKPGEAIIVDQANGMDAGCVASPGCPVSSCSEESVSVVSYADNKVVIEATLSTPGYLLLKDAWYPGWQVRIHDTMDPRAEPRLDSVMRADLLYRTVALGAGSWRVTFSYGPCILYLGLALTVCGLGCLALYVVVGSKRRG
ncbi:MAG: hypothetical protein JXC32_13370 [Anaerolineae bacterium]|nr:hypothetical protein [Anaerolineae bacterium]